MAFLLLNKKTYMNKTNYLSNFFIECFKSVFHFKKDLSRYKHLRNITPINGGQIISRLIINGKPFSVTRLGSTECSILNHSIKLKYKIEKNTPERVKNSAKINAGFFPTSDEYILRFGELLSTSLRNADLYCRLGSFMEDYFISSFCKKDVFISLNRATDPLKGYWTKSLKGKKVLVISSFSKEIERQYLRREFIFKDQDMLPEFKLITYDAPVSFGDVIPKEKDFFEVLEKCKSDIAKIDFDIALVGCGGYGLPLCSFIKDIGKGAIHTAGSTQLLFGILGKRWENSETVNRFKNDYWIFPKEKPIGFEKIENGCYW